jgi:hypothetical protein
VPDWKGSFKRDYLSHQPLEILAEAMKHVPTWISGAMCIVELSLWLNQVESQTRRYKRGALPRRRYAM